MTDTRFKRTPSNGCSGCRCDFVSVTLFDAHRVGKNDYDWSLDKPDGRRCLDADEMSERGWKQDDKGRWFDPASRARIQKYFSEVGIPSEKRSEAA